MSWTSSRFGIPHPLLLSLSVIHPTISSFQVQKGLSVLAQGLDFCHSNAKLIHGDINPRSVFVNVKVTLWIPFFSHFSPSFLPVFILSG